MGKKVGLLLVTAGLLLILVALGLLLYHRYEDQQAGEQAQTVAEELVQIVHETAQTSEAVTEVELPSVVVDGDDYIGYLHIAALSLTLPVQQEWDYTRLKRSPCRQFGWPESGDFVIAAHNYASHFKYLSRLQAGDLVEFYDLCGRQYCYQVEKLAIVQPTDVEAVQNSGYDLVLYTCTPGGRSRTAVYCSRQ